ncbi:hypothetical protein [uncultured Arthrobacter sp.]|uniref:hypothetical protein n=1 Tax=uncultured Arthrobacter sp. TaxID=114050 RepID=UPI00321720B1
MALADSVTHFAGKAPATKNRVDLLIDRLGAEKSPDLPILLSALRDGSLRPSALTNALRKEYGHDAVKDTSVSLWRRQHLVTDVNGL